MPKFTDNAFEVIIQEEDFDVNEALNKLRTCSDNVGALVNFVGYVRRDKESMEVESLYLEHYPGMTEKQIGNIVNEASQKWDLISGLVIHRVGSLVIGEQIVLVAIASKHRKEAFAAAEYIMDFLKADAAIWKKALGPKGEKWIDANKKDEEALEKWSSSKFLAD